MSSQPNFCIDIFSNIANLLRQFTAVSNDPTSSFSHGRGFEPQAPQSVTSMGAPQDDMFQWLAIAAFILFLIVGIRAPRQNLKGQPV